MAAVATLIQDGYQYTTGPNARASLTYIVVDAVDEDAVNIAVTAVRPATWHSLPPISRDLTPTEDNTTWLCAVNYTLRRVKTIPTTGESQYNFDTTGGTERILQRLAAVQKYSGSGAGTGEDTYGAINDDGDTVHGVDIIVPKYSFSETHYIANDSVTNAYKGKLYSLTGTTNDAGFKGSLAGEALFLGAVGSSRGDEDWEINFRFAARPNRVAAGAGQRTPVPVKFDDGNTVNIDVGGWEYLWFYYAKVQSANDKSLIHAPKYAYVERVYEEGDFSDLGIGV